jgi:hypothetical protein
MMYATDENGGFYKYDWTAPSIPTSLYPTVIEGSTLYGTFVAFIGTIYLGHSCHIRTDTSHRNLSILTG